MKSDKILSCFRITFAFFSTVFQFFKSKSQNKIINTIQLYFFNPQKTLPNEISNRYYVHTLAIQMFCTEVLSHSLVSEHIAKNEKQNEIQNCLIISKKCETVTNSLPHQVSTLWYLFCRTEKFLHTFSSL